MRKTYHIKINVEEEPSFNKVTKQLGIRPDSAMFVDLDVADRAKGEIIYDIKLSKYELLSLRLICRTGLIKEI